MSSFCPRAFLRREMPFRWAARLSLPEGESCQHPGQLSGSTDTAAAVPRGRHGPVRQRRSDLPPKNTWVSCDPAVPHGGVLGVAVPFPGLQLAFVQDEHSVVGGGNELDDLLRHDSIRRRKHRSMQVALSMWSS